MNKAEPEHEIADISQHIESSRKRKESGEVRKFLKGALKIALAIIIAALVLAGIAAAIGAFISFRQEARNRNLAETKVWEEITVSSLQNATFNLSTKWEDYNLYYQFYVDGFPSEVQAEFDKTGYKRNVNAGFTIVFLDLTGFKVDSIHVLFRSMNRIVGDDGSYSGLYMKDTHYMSADEYRKVAMWEITWSL